MFNAVARKLFGTQNDRELKSIYPIVAQINEWEPKIKPLSDEELKAKTPYFRERLARGETLDDLLPEAFAVVREAASRVIGQRHYDVQLIGGVTLHRGRIAEMRTGEGKTLVATLPSYLNGLSGKGVHVITVNDYLARRDAGWMGQIHQFLGLTTGIIVHGLSDTQRKQNYGCDVTYGTNNEFGFDYLRDNMKFRLADYVQRELNFAIVDEVDSILIDEARTPLIISGPTEDSTDMYYRIDAKLQQEGGLVKETDYTIDEKSKTASLSPEGIDKMEKRLGVSNMYDPAHIELLHHVNQGLRAHMLFHRDVDYVIKDDEVVIVDEFTGRLMPGRRWSDGLHQAVEAKEGVQIENENQTLATITFQNYFRMYNKLSGMTGTADTEATEFKQIYKLDVTIIPTNKSICRDDYADVIYKSQVAKFKAAVVEIKRLHEKGQPVLVGTVSVEKSELLAGLLKRDGVRHNVLNAKQNEREADIVAQAGRKGAVTIATNMAGRGTDILLGGNHENMAKLEAGILKAGATDEEKAEWQKKHDEALARLIDSCAREREEVKALGGLFILGTERHDSRRIDNQLRGRAGRQGDPGASRFYLSFEDDLLRIFGQSELLKRTVAAMEEDVPIEHKWTTKAIENAQRKVEGHNYDIRKHLLEYDDVMNQQRKVIYAWRRDVLALDNLKSMVFTIANDIAEEIAEDFFPGGKLKKENGQARLDLPQLKEAFATTFQFLPNITESDINPFNNKGLQALINRLAQARYLEKEKQLSEPVMRQLEKMILLSTIDQLWKDHLQAMDSLREGIGLQGYGQKDPLIAYKKEGFRFFEMMMGQINGDVVRKMYAVQMNTQNELNEELNDDSDDDSDTSDASSDHASHDHAHHEHSLPGLGSSQAPKQIQYNIDAQGNLVPNAEQNKTPLQAPPASPIDLGWNLKQPKNLSYSHAGTAASGATSKGEYAGAGRNDPCPCGSGKKYKKCHGA